MEHKMRLFTSLSSLSLKLGLAVGLVIASLSAVQAGDSHLVIKPSTHSVKDTLDNLTAALTRAGITVMARIDHAAGAKKVGKSLLPTELLIFGNPKLGTPLIEANREIAIDLPMKAPAWRDDKGKVWLAYVRPSVLKARHAITGRDALFAKMAAALDKLTDAATGAK
jgi:uncharacterized protein (DUF302 family)